jgi:hypothetical protein
MDFIIKISDTKLQNIIQYEKEIIHSVALMNLTFIEANKKEFGTFCLKCLGIHYEDYKADNFEIDHISRMLEQGFGKCDSIVAWYIAVFLKEGFESEPIIVKNGIDSYHVLLALKDNNETRILDPSKEMNSFSKEFCEECANNAQYSRRTTSRRITSS